MFTLCSFQVLRLVQPGPLGRQVSHPGPQQATLSCHVIQRREDVGWPEQDGDNPVSFRPGHTSTGVGIGIDV